MDPRCKIDVMQETWKRIHDFDNIWLNCALRLDVIFRFFITNFDYYLYTNKLKEKFSVIVIGNFFSMGCSFHPRARLHRSSDAKPEWDTLSFIYAALRDLSALRPGRVFLMTEAYSNSIALEMHCLKPVQSNIFVSIALIFFG
jgi:hypothetical protein